MRFGGELPGASLESGIVDVFERSPRRVVEAIDVVARDLAGGLVRSGWAVLRKRVEDAGPVRDVTVGDKAEKQRRVERALRWIDNAGLYCDRLEDVEDELFGIAPTGPLSAYAEDREVRAQVAGYWGEARPRGEQADAEAEAYMAEQAARRSTLRGELEPAELEVTPEPEPAEARMAA